MQNKDINNIIITGGGTGGHLIPAFAIADALKNKKENINIRFIGSEYGIESNLYKDRIEKSYLIKIKGLKRNLQFSNILYNFFILPINCLLAIIKVNKIYNQFLPDIVIGTGGYSSAIPLFVARFRKIKIIIQEQNAIPGLVNRLFLKVAYKVCFGFKSIEKSNKFINTGNPTFIKSTDNNFINTKILNNNEKFTIFILGGSQGSVPINKHFIKNYKKYIKMGVQLIWQCGHNNLSNIKNIIKYNDVYLCGFIKPADMPHYYNKADLVISRAGALTLSELANFNIPSILIPFPYSSNNHQLHNAKYFYSKKSAEIVEQRELDSGILESKVENLIKNTKILESMKNQIKKIAKPNAADIIASEILGAN